jgi:DNA gyrase subunit B
LKEVGTARGTGTKITFKPDPEIFKDAQVDYDTLEWRLRELAFLNPGLVMKITDERSNREAVFKANAGIVDFVNYLNQNKQPLHPVIHTDRTVDRVRVQVAIQYTSSDEEQVYCYTNTSRNGVGGTHLDGFCTALARALKAHKRREEVSTEKFTLARPDFLQGITCVMSLQVPEPQFESYQKLRLQNPEIEHIVAGIVYEGLSEFLSENPTAAGKIMKKVTIARKTRKAGSNGK